MVFSTKKLAGENHSINCAGRKWRKERKKEREIEGKRGRGRGGERRRGRKKQANNPGTGVIATEVNDGI